MISEVFDLGLVLLKLNKMSFFVFEVLKWFNEELQGFARISHSFTKIYDSLQPVLTPIGRADRIKAY